MHKAISGIPEECLFSAPYLHCEDNLTVQTVVGVYEWERIAERPLILSLQLSSVQPLYLTRTMIENQLMIWIAPCRYRLLETLAEYLTQRMFAQWGCTRIVLEVEKPGAMGDLARVGIRITRHIDRSQND